MYRGGWKNSGKKRKAYSKAYSFDWREKHQRRCFKCGQWYNYKDGFRGRCYDCSLDDDIGRAWNQQAHKGIAYDKAYEELTRTGWFYPEEGSK